MPVQGHTVASCSLLSMKSTRTATEEEDDNKRNTNTTRRRLTLEVVVSLCHPPTTVTRVALFCDRRRFVD